MQIVLFLHNLLRWGVLIFGLWSIINAVSGLSNKRLYSQSDNRSNLFFMICCDVQLLIGLLLFFGNDWFGHLKSGMGDVMKNPVQRFFTVEHAAVMLVAWILVHAGRVAVKKASSDNAKHKKALIFFGIALLLILVSIPWPFRAEIARPLYRGI